MGRRFKSPSFQTLIKSNSAVVIAADFPNHGSLRFCCACGVRLDSNMAGSVAIKSWKGPVVCEIVMTELVADPTAVPKVGAS